MKTPLLFLVAGLWAVPLLAAPASDLLPPLRRAETVALAQKLLAPPDATGLPEGDALKNPFSPTHLQPKVEAKVDAPPLEESIREKLQAIAPLITPTGTANVGGASLLLFGQKKLKVGDRLPIVFEGKPYELVIAAIERTSFTLRLQGEEVTRPIKPVSKP